MAHKATAKASAKAQEPETTVDEATEDKAPTKAPSPAAAENLQLYTELLQFRMLDVEHARVRETRNIEGRLELEFTNGDTVTADREAIVSAKGLEGIRNLIAEAIDRRTRP